MFVDRIELFVKGGDGGRGMMSFRREKYVPKGGPDGGDGGDGGSVIVRAVAGTDSLAQIVHQKHWRAPGGGPGGTALRHGKRAQDLVIAVPPGLIEGAHSGVGLGHEFLRHVERTRVLVHLVEPLPADSSDPLTNYRTVRKELELYSAPLAAKPEIVAVSKAELTGSEAVRER